MEKFKFVDLFAGIGGIRIGFESIGGKCVFTSEWNEWSKKTYIANFGDNEKFIGDITNFPAEDIPDHDVLLAGFPCQPFSIAGVSKKNSLGKPHGFECTTQGTLFFDVARIIKAKRPKVVFMENVKNFTTHDNGNTLKVVKDTMNDLDYDFYSNILNSLDFGIPQKRERIYMVCFRKDLNIKKFKFPKPFKLSTFVEDLLLPDEEVSNLIVNRPDLVLKDIEIKNNSNRTIRIGTVGKGGQGERIYSPKGIAITLSAYGGGIFAKTGGYLINGKTRKLHPRECARIMGYPDSYLIHSSASQAYKQFGNSVVVNVLQYITKNIGEALNYEYNYI